MHPNLKAFLDTIAVSELTQALLDISDNGYNVVVGSTAKNPILFSPYTDHPRKTLNFTLKSGKIIKSTAAGRYQLLERFYDYYKKALNLPDFSPDSQDKICLQLIRECQATDDITTGHADVALAKCASRWASFPGSGYGQHENDEMQLLNVFVSAGGKLA